jgi:hypothetical protein
MPTITSYTTNCDLTALGRGNAHPGLRVGGNRPADQHCPGSTRSRCTPGALLSERFGLRVGAVVEVLVHGYEWEAEHRGVDDETIRSVRYG